MPVPISRRLTGAVTRSAASPSGWQMNSNAVRIRAISSRATSMPRMRLASAGLSVTTDGTCGIG